MIQGLVEIVSELVAQRSKRGFRLQAGASAGLALALSPAEAGDWSRLVMSREGKSPSAEEEASVLLGVFRGLDALNKGSRSFRVQRGIRLIGGHVGTVVEWPVDVTYETVANVIESQIAAAKAVEAKQETLFPLPDDSGVRSGPYGR